MIQWIWVTDIECAMLFKFWMNFGFSSVINVLFSLNVTYKRDFKYYSLQ